MALELWSTIASIGTFVVIATTAIVALVQLRHMRSSNQIAALTEVRETIESERFAQARRFLSMELPRLIDDPVGRKKLMARPLPPELEPLRIVGNFFETMGAFVKFGVIDKTIACDIWGSVVLDTWSDMEPVVAVRRPAAGNPALWENYEYLAVIAEDYTARHPTAFPAGVRRKKFGQRSLAAAAAASKEKEA